MWRCLYIWAVAPKIVTFRPIIPAALVFAIGLFIALQFLPWRESSKSMDTHMREFAQVRFTLFYPKAHSVSIIGSFNQWKSRGYEMKQLTDGNGWVLELELPKGRYEYAFLVDGKVIVPDPSVPFSQSDGFGNSNSVLFVSDDAENII
jgi:1,4-alpha-glucan branching enzyme